MSRAHGPGTLCPQPTLPGAPGVLSQLLGFYLLPASGQVFDVGTQSTPEVFSNCFPLPDSSVPTSQGPGDLWIAQELGIRDFLSSI